MQEISQTRDRIAMVGHRDPGLECGETLKRWGCSKHPFLLTGGSEMARYLGVDLHRNHFTVCTIGENGRHDFRKYDIHSLKYFASRLRPTDQVAV